MTYTDVFGSATLPPAEYGYASFTLTTNTTFVWPYNTDGSSYPVAKVMDIACDGGNEVTLPDCTEVSTGEDFLIRNVGANVLIVKDASGVQVASVAVGAASYFYLTDNTSAAGVFGVIGFGVGTSTANASSLVGYGIKAVGASLNQAHPVQPTNTGITLSADHRAKLVVFTGGVATFTLDTAATLGDDYFTMFRNDGTGTATIDPAASELIDGMTSMQVQPGESLMLICTGTKWYSVGYGRSTLYQFTQLTKDVSVGGTVTLSATEAANKLITFIGNPSAAVEVVVPAVVAVYYTQSAISTVQTITLKTSAGSGVGISQGTRIIALCDGTNVVSAQSAVANASVSLTDGSALVPSLFFATQANTGLFKSGTQDVGVTVNGSTVGVFGSTGLQTATIGPNSTQRHTLPAVPSDTVTLNTATQTLTNKTISVDNNTISGIAASSFVLSNASGNINGSAAQKAIPTGVVVGTTDTQTLTNKTFSLASNTLTGTLAQFNTALSDADFATLAGSETLTNKTISGATNTLSNIGNSSLTNSSVTINGSTVALGGSTTVTATAGSALTIGTGLSGTSYNGSTPVTIAVNSTIATLTGTQTLTNKTLTAPVINSPTGITKADVGLGNVDNTSDATKNSASATLTNKTISVDSNTISGLAVSSFALTNASGNLDGLAAAKAVPAGVVVGTTDTQTLTNKTLSSPIINAPTGITKTDVGLGNVDNTSDANKPVSAATLAALNLKANAASPTTTGTFTHSGDIVLSGSGKRITGDFFNATVANRVMFQTSTVNTGTNVSTIPSGTGLVSGFVAHNQSDPTHSGYASMSISDTEMRLNAGATGNGYPALTYLPMTFYTGGLERMRIDSIGNTQVLGNFAIGSTAPLSNVKAYIAQGANMTLGTDYAVYVQGQGYSGGIALNTTSMQIGQNSASRALTFHSGTGFAERLRIDASGNVRVTSPAGLGYGTGAGGTVTQATSKSTTVTLNKPTGQITMNAEALAANTRIVFQVINSLVTADDIVVATYVDDFGTAYRVDVQTVWAGYFQIGLTNVTAGSLSQAVRINFAIIKGAAS